MDIRHFFHYDDRYFQFTKHTGEELYQLQSLIMDTKQSSDLGKDIASLGKYEKKEIETALRMYFKEGKIKRDKVDVIGNKPVYRYYT